MSDQRRLKFVILACGSRGDVFSRWIASHPNAGEVVAVADPNPIARNHLGDRHGLDPVMRFERWEHLLARPRFADAAINTTMDQLHTPSALQAMNLGYHMLLEKPMATTLQECIAIDESARTNNRIVSVCHSMRYHRIYQLVKRMMEEGKIGRLISFDQLEAVEPIHQSHSFVRGNWANESRSTFMLMSKSCHDIDVLAWLVGKPCRRVSSFGSLTYFRRENAPAGSGERCVDCAVEPDCRYSAIKLYTKPDSEWARAVRISGSPEERREILKSSPYGRCAWKCDNDVVDHQVVNFEFAEEITGTFTMTAFATEGRFIRLHGTDGWIRASIDHNTIEYVRFGANEREFIKLEADHTSHGGADDRVMHAFVAALRENNPKHVLTSTAESLVSHRIVFAAETARQEGRVVSLDAV